MDDMSEITGAVSVNSRGYRESEHGREMRPKQRNSYAGRFILYDSPRANKLLDYLRERKFQFLLKAKVRKDLSMTDSEFKCAIETAALIDASVGEEYGEIFYWNWKEWDETKEW